MVELARNIGCLHVWQLAYAGIHQFGKLAGRRLLFGFLPARVTNGAERAQPIAFRQALDFREQASHMVTTVARIAKEEVLVVACLFADTA